MPPVSVFEAFIQDQPSDPSAVADDASSCSDLLAFVQEHQDDDGGRGWKRAYQR
jgi:hypothetical protein